MDASKKCADYWIKKLELIPHPGLETGFLREVFRDSHGVVGTAGADRNAATNIYFLHKKAEPFGRETVFFRMRNSELLNFYVGHPVTLFLMPDPNSATIAKTILGPDPEEGHNYFVALPRDRWFVRRLESDDDKAFALIGCTVVPGYDDADIETTTYGQIIDSIGRNK